MDAQTALPRLVLFLFVVYLLALRGHAHPPLSHNQDPEGLMQARQVAEEQHHEDHILIEARDAGKGDAGKVVPKGTLGSRDGAIETQQGHRKPKKSRNSGCFGNRLDQIGSRNMGCNRPRQN